MSTKKQVRASFRAAVLGRDRYRCVACGKPGYDRQGGGGHAAHHRPGVELVPMDAHHITDRNQMPNGGYVVENGITLCDEGCHRRAEAFHQAGQAETGFSPADLYRMIGSSHEAAVAASGKLA